MLRFHFIKEKRFAMTPEEIKTLIEQEAIRRFPTSLLTDRECNRLAKRNREKFMDACTFYEQSILPEVLKEKDGDLTGKLLDAIPPAYQKEIDYSMSLEIKISTLESQLSQLQSKME